MARNDEANDIMAQTSFLYGGNAHYIEDMYARFQDDPGSVPAEWHAFFADLKDDPEQIRKSAAGASWKQANWPVQANGELVSALDGNWGAVEKAVSDKLKGKAKQAGQSLDPAVAEQATRDSVRAIMMIRAFRMRGHLHANLDPLGLAQQPDDDYNELSPEAYGFTEADYDRPIFIDTCWGLNTRPSARCSISSSGPIARRWASSSCTFPTPKRSPGSRSASRVRTRASTSPKWARRRSCRS
jgi:2-oxoglutarate dehydrogenase E1 component